MLWEGPSGTSGQTGSLCPACQPIVIDYPENGSIFPPDISAPVFLWRDPVKNAVAWRIVVSFADGAPSLSYSSPGPRLRIGPMDQDAVAKTNEPPKLTPQQAQQRAWMPDETQWKAIKLHSRAAAATVAIAGFTDARMSHAVSTGGVTIATSNDPVGAPIFYRDVPLMPTETEEGVIKPIPSEAVRLIKWRLRDIGQRESRVVLSRMPVCANCHSFSLDGKTLGMDLDGVQNNKGQYSLTPLERETSIGNENVIQWSGEAGRLASSMRVGFMSQVSPDGKYVVTTIDPQGTANTSNYYVQNFLDYRFLQVFYPTRGVLMWYNRSTRKLEPLPGADDPRFVQMGGVWSPDGKYLVFARAAARDP